MRRLLLPLCLVGCSLIAACSGGVDDPSGAPAAGSVRVGGTVTGLGEGKQLIVADTGGASANLAANGPYSLTLPTGATYNLRVQLQPPGQTCQLSNPTGVANAEVDNITVTCADNPPPSAPIWVGGTVDGLAGGASLTLQLAAGGSLQDAVVAANGPFQFSQAIAGGYAITVKTPPAGQVCTVFNGKGTTGVSPPPLVVCITVAGGGTGGTAGWRLSGTLQGNLGVVTLHNTVNGDTLVLNTDGAFAFGQTVAPGAAYNIVVAGQSSNQACSVSQGAGVATADVGNILASCAAAPVSPPASASVPAPVAVPATPTGLTITYSVKGFNIAWGAVAAPAGGGAVSYRLFEDPDGAGPAAGAQVGGTLAATSLARPVVGLLHTRLNAAYNVQACNSAGCSAATAAAVADVAQAIGYFKASNTGAGDLFGFSVAISGDGNTLAVGAPEEDSAATGVDGNQADNSASNSGAVYVFTRGAGGWSQQAYVKASNAELDDRFGWAVALSFDGNTLAVGAYVEKSGAAGVGGNQADNSRPVAGATYIFTRSAGAWSQQAYIKASNPDNNDEFGGAVALSFDGNTLAVGTVGEDSSATGIGGAQGAGAATSGAVYVFTRDGAGTWSQQAYVKASNTGANFRFGYSVALSFDGSTLAVGSVGEASAATGVNGNEADNSMVNAGAAYVFTRDGAGTWSQQAYVKASNTGAGHVFGTSVALSANGSTLAVGATGEAAAAGAAYVYARDGAGAWSHQAYVKPAFAAANQWFGRAVALSADGQTLAVGARNESSIAAAINGNAADASAPEAGAAYVFTHSAGLWTQQAYIKASNPGAGDRFSSVALSADGQTLAVGARNEDSAASGIGGNQADDSAANAGAVYIY